MKKAVGLLRRGVLAVVSDESLYLFFAFLFATVFSSSIFVWQRTAIDLLNSYVLVPWGLVLCVLRLMRADEHTLMQKDTGLLTLLFAWATVPFFLRFGVTFNNVTTAYNHAVVIFAIYAMTREEEPARRAAMLDGLCALMAVTAFVCGGVLLMYALTGRTFVYDNPSFNTFGVIDGKLQAGMYYNRTGMDCLCAMMMCLVGVSRRKSKIGQLAHLMPAVLMALVVVLTQSRTARYSMLLALAAGAYGGVAARLAQLRRLMRHGAAAVAACLVLVAGFVVSDGITAAAIDHYNGQSVVMAQALADETQKKQQKPAEVRDAADATFSDRTEIWSNLFAYWKENPKKLLIGNGVGRTGSLIVKGTIHEKLGGVGVHNTYLQVMADFGLIGAGITLAFLIMVFFPALRVFLAPAGAGFAGGRALCMLVAACLATGMMESYPLGMMSEMNMMLYYALAVLCAEGNRLNRKA